MTATETIRIVAAAVPGVFWLICCIFNLWVGAGYVLVRQTPSPVVLIGSIAGVATLMLQPLSLAGHWSPVLFAAILPDLEWLGGSLVAFAVERLWKRR